MDFDEIMREITGGMTGDNEKDIRYLMDQAEKYKDHEMGKEIVRAVGRLVYKCVPEDKRAELDRIVTNDTTSYEAVLEEVRFKQHEKKFDEALVLLENLIRKLEEAKMFEDDQVSEYHCFNEFFEEALYKMSASPEKEVRYATIPFDQIYGQQGTLLVDLRRLKDAEAALLKALRWNPANVHLAFEYAETAKIQGDMDEFFHRTLAAFRYAFRPDHVARCFRNLGFYFIEKKLWEEAVACFTMSLQFEPDSSMAMSELYYIQQTAGKVIPPPRMDQLKMYARKYGFPAGADPDVLGLAYAYGKRFAEDGNVEGARYCWQILYDLTDDEKIKEMLDKLPEEES